MPKFDLSTLVRPKIYSLEPYRCARDDFKEGILLDANENTHGPMLSNDQLSDLNITNEELNRYPDPHQIDLKTKIANFRNREATISDGLQKQLKIVTPKDPKDQVTAENLCLGVGSDESIDALIRTICRPGKDKLLICPPTYGMYKITSQINDVDIVPVPLNFDTFEVQEDKIISTIKDDPNRSIKMVFVTSPGNPTAKLVDVTRIEKLLQWGLENWNGLVVVDEAYVDFSPIGSSFSVLVNKYPNLVVFQTLSKSFGLAGIRLGITFASKELARVLNALKAPYNISSLTSEIANKAVSEENIKRMRETTNIYEVEKQKLLQEFKQIKQFGKVIGGLDANFILIQVVNSSNEPDSTFAKKVYEKMAVEKKVVVRYRGSEPGCAGALRITIGTEEENKIMVQKFKEVFAELGN